MPSTTKPTPRLDYSKPAMQQKTLEGHSECVSAVAVLPDGRVVSGSYDKTLKVWDIKTGQCLATLSGHSSCVEAVAVLPDDRVVSGSDDNTLKVWDIKTGQCLMTLEGHSGYVYAVAVLPDGRVVSGSYDKTLKVWDRKTGQCLTTLEGHSRPVNALVVLPDGRVVSTSVDEILKVWDIKTGQCVTTLKKDSGVMNAEAALLAVAVLPDNRVVSGSYDKTIKVWDIKTGQCLTTLEGHSNVVHALAVLPDGRIVSGSSDGTLKIWDSQTGQCLKTLEGHGLDVVCAVAVLPDGRVVSGSGDRTLKVWDFPVLEETLSFSAPPSPAVSSSSKSEVSVSTPLPASPVSSPASSLETKFSSLHVSFQIAYAELKEEQKLGQGGYGEVYLGAYRYQKVAIKKLLLNNPTKSASTEFEKEMEVMSKLRSPHVVQFYGICLTPKCIVMEYMPKGSLYDVLHSDEALAWSLRAKIALDIACGLAFLHQSHILHRDLKSLNVLLDNGYQAKLCDFGLAKIKTETATTSTVGTSAKGSVAWMAPELFDLEQATYSPKSDVYAYGMVLWEIASRKLPYERANGKAELIMLHVVMQQKRETMPSDTPPEIKTVIESCWKQAPNERPTADKVTEALQKLSLFAQSAPSPSPASTVLSGPVYVSNFNAKS